MTTIEDRLREDLPTLADRMIAGDIPDRPGAPVVSGRRRRVWPAIAAAMLLIAGAWGIAAVSRGDDDPSVQTGPTAPANVDDFGTWRPISTAPIEPRAFPVAAWTGHEAIFWAGTDLAGSTAFTDGAAYDPATATWRSIPVPGWGHPGMASAVFDDGLYALAKNGGGRFDLQTETWTDLPRVDGMSFTDAVATDEALFGVGPVDDGGGNILGIARYDERSDRWVRIDNGMRAATFGSNRFGGDVVWTGSEIVVWQADGAGLAFDPASEDWRAFPALTPSRGVVVASRLAATDAGLVALVAVEDAGRTQVWMATSTTGGWTWQDLDLPIVELERATVVPAGEWLVVLQPEAHPTLIHVPTGRSEVVVDGPLGGVEGAGAVWTGDELVVWGGERRRLEGVEAPSVGAIWTPPEHAPSEASRDGWTEFDPDACPGLDSLQELRAAGRQSDEDCVVAILAGAARCRPRCRSRGSRSARR